MTEKLINRQDNASLKTHEVFASFLREKRSRKFKSKIQLLITYWNFPSKIQENCLSIMLQVTTHCNGLKQLAHTIQPITDQTLKKLLNLSTLISQLSTL